MKTLPMILRFFSGSVTPARRREKLLARVHVHEAQVEVVAEGLDHLLGLALPQHAVVDEDAREPVADGLRARGRPPPTNRRRPRGRRPPAPSPTCSRDVGDRSPRRRSPCVQSAAAARHIEEEAAGASRCRAACGPPRGGTARRRCDARSRRTAANGAALGPRDDLEALRAVGRPGRRGSSTRRPSRPRRSRRRARRGRTTSTRAAPYSRASACSTSPPSSMARELHPVADAQDGHAQIEDGRVDAWGALVEHARRPAR